MTKERLIKKYANRRLYDASISKHVTLEDIRDLIVRGEKIKVVEDKTGEDITRLILLQVIAEQEQFGKPILTTQLLESIIRYYGGPMQDFMAGYLEQSVAAFMRQQESVQQQISQMLTSAPPPDERHGRAHAPEHGDVEPHAGRHAPDAGATPQAARPRRPRRRTRGVGRHESLKGTFTFVGSATKVNCPLRLQALLFSCAACSHASIARLRSTPQ